MSRELAMPALHTLPGPFGPVALVAARALPEGAAAQALRVSEADVERWLRDAIHRDVLLAVVRELRGVAPWWSTATSRGLTRDVSLALAAALAEGGVVALPAVQAEALVARATAAHLAALEQVVPPAATQPAQPAQPASQPAQPAPTPPPASAPPPAPPQELTWIEIEVLDADEQPIAGRPYRLVASDGSVHAGTVGADGLIRVADIPEGVCTLAFPTDDEAEWRPAGAPA